MRKIEYPRLYIITTIHKYINIERAQSFINNKRLINFNNCCKRRKIINNIKW